MKRTLFNFLIPMLLAGGVSQSLSAETWGEWEDYATGTYDAHFWYRSPMKDLQVRRRVSTSNPQREQYMVVGLFGQTPGCAPVDLVIDVNRAVPGPTSRDVSMWVDDQYIESYDVYGENKEIYLCDGYTYYDTYFPSNPEYAMQYEDASYFREETGVFNIYAYYHYPDGTVPFLDAFYQDKAQGPETLTLHGAQFRNYTADVRILGVRSSESGTVMETDVNLNDLGKVRLCALPGTLSDVRSVAERLSRGEGDYEEIAESGNCDVPMENVAGKHTLVYLTILPDGTAYQYGSEEYEYDPNWISLGQGELTDGFISRFLETDMTVNHGYRFEESDFTYPVEIEESTETPGLYRVVNPYGETSPYYGLDYSVLTLDKRKRHCLTINASDPDCVYVEDSESGFYYGTYPLVLYSEAYDYLAEGYSKDQVPEELWGKKRGDVIEFPDGSEGAGVLCAKILGSPADIWGRQLRLLLPGSSEVAGMPENEYEPTVWYDIHGRRVSRPSEKGLYVKRTGSETRKVLIN